MAWMGPVLVAVLGIALGVGLGRAVLEGLLEVAAVLTVPREH